MNRFPGFGLACVFTAAALTASAAGAQTAPQDAPSATAQTNSPAPPAPQQPAALNPSDAVPDGTHFLVRLNDALNTGKDQPGRKFTVTIIEPLETAGAPFCRPAAKSPDTSAASNPRRSPDARGSGSHSMTSTPPAGVSLSSPKSAAFPAKVA
jgi:hypothetical protein